MNQLAAALLLISAIALSSRPRADGPGDNQAASVRPIPPTGVAIPEEVRAELMSGLKELQSHIARAEKAVSRNADLLSLLPDVQIFHKAVHDALVHNEIFNPTNEIPAARELVKTGLERAVQLESGKPAWPDATGLVVRAYRSKIDGSIQPYGLVIPAGVAASPEIPRRLDAWFHGRDERLSELNFLTSRQRSPGEFTPPNTIVLHLYGRYCNANKFAGEIDLFEALADIKKRYAIDENRIVVRGFSMGGAACWQFAVHYAGLWAGAAPGAGFSETPEFLRIFQKENVQPAWWERKLYHMYDCTDYAVNLSNCPTVAYSGEEDIQKQAADIMAKALAEEGIELTHIIGPKTGHRYHPDSKREINQRIDQIAASGRNPVPRKVHFTTWTLRYNQMLWVRMDEMDRHWERARVDAEITSPTSITLNTTNTRALTLTMPAGYCPLDPTIAPAVSLDGQVLAAPRVGSDRSWDASFRKYGEKWTVAEPGKESGLRKRHGLQGPIDDAFMDSFIMVLPSGTPIHPNIGKWTATEQQHALDHWRKQFRGNARIVKDRDLTEDQIRDSHLVLWGDPESNLVLNRIAPELPIKWTAEKVELGDKQFPADTHLPVFVYPNPLNPRRYVVLNSGFTFREYDYLNNARQIAKLPDFAILDTRQPSNPRSPGKVVLAGFFTDDWRLPNHPGEE